MPHTKLPWSLETENGAIVDGKGRQLAAVMPYNRQRNGEHIVRAVNSHTGLLDAAKVARNLLDDLAADCPAISTGEIEAIRDHVGQAISRAES